MFDFRVPCWYNYRVYAGWNGVAKLMAIFERALLCIGVYVLPVRTASDLLLNFYESFLGPSSVVGWSVGQWPQRHGRSSVLH